MRAGMGWSEVAMCAFAYRLGGENTFLRKGSFPLEQFAETDIASPECPMLIRIFESVKISTITLLTVYYCPSSGSASFALPVVALSLFLPRAESIRLQIR